MWQPEQPSSQAVATVIFAGVAVRRSLGVPPAGEDGQEVLVLDHLADRRALLDQGAGRADLDALAAAGAGLALAPGAGQVGDHPAVDCRGPSRPRCGRPRSRRTPARSGCRGRSGCGPGGTSRASCRPRSGPAVGHPHVVDAALLGQRLQLAVAVGDAHRADVVALGEEQFDDRAPVALQPLGVGGDLHALGRPASSRRRTAGSARRSPPCTGGRRPRR